MIHTMASVVAWVLVLAIVAAEIIGLVWLARLILRKSAGRPWHRAFMLVGFAVGPLSALGRIAGNSAAGLQIAGVVGAHIAEIGGDSVPQANKLGD